MKFRDLDNLLRLQQPDRKRGEHEQVCAITIREQERNEVGTGEGRRAGRRDPSEQDPDRRKD